MAVEQPKKITGGAFGQYLTENRAALLKEVPGQPATAAVKLASQRFKALNKVAKSKYQMMYEAAKQKYAKDIAAFLSAGGEMKARKKAMKKSKEPNKLEKPEGGAFGCFLQAKMAEFMKEFGPDPDVEAVTKLARERWRETSKAEKRSFQQDFNKNMAEYKKAAKGVMKASVPPVVKDNEVDGGETEDKEQEVEVEHAPRKRKAANDGVVKENDQEGGGEEDKEQEVEVECAPMKRKATSKNDAPAAKKGKIASSDEVEAEAKQLGYRVQLKTLTQNVKVKSSPGEILAELKKYNGSVVAAKKALLQA